MVAFVLCGWGMPTGNATRRQECLLVTKPGTDTRPEAWTFQCMAVYLPQFGCSTRGTGPPCTGGLGPRTPNFCKEQHLCVIRPRNWNFNCDLWAPVQIQPRLSIQMNQQSAWLKKFLGRKEGMNCLHPSFLLFFFWALLKFSTGLPKNAFAKEKKVKKKKTTKMTRSYTFSCTGALFLFDYLIISSRSWRFCWCLVRTTQLFLLTWSDWKKSLHIKRAWNSGTHPGLCSVGSRPWTGSRRRGDGYSKVKPSALHSFWHCNCMILKEKKRKVVKSWWISFSYSDNWKWMKLFLLSMSPFESTWKLGNESIPTHFVKASPKNSAREISRH